MTQSKDLLWKLGIRSTYKGYRQMAAALASVRENEDYLFSVTKILYPDVAKEFHTNPASIERNFRTVIDVCWEDGNRELLNEIAGYHLHARPTTKQFIDILASYMRRSQADG